VPAVPGLLIGYAALPPERLGHGPRAVAFSLAGDRAVRRNVRLLADQDTP
jgi:hypothetical protein